MIYLDKPGHTRSIHGDAGGGGGGDCGGGGGGEVWGWWWWWWSIFSQSSCPGMNVMTLERAFYPWFLRLLQKGVCLGQWFRHAILLGSRH